MSQNDTTTQEPSGESAECPTCGKRLDTEHGVKIHHKTVHGESIAGVEVVCSICNEEFTAFPSEADDRSTCGDEGCVREVLRRKNSGQIEDLDDEPWHDADRLRELYLEEWLSTYEIADRLGCYPKTVSRWLDRHGIDKRSRPPIAKELADEEYLREQYLEAGKSSLEIADEIGCAHGSVSQALRRHDIPIRSFKEAASVASDTLRDSDELEHLYNEERLSASKIADQLGCTSPTVLRWMSRHGIERRPAAPYLGEYHHRFNGGEYAYGRGWNESTKEAVRERQGRQCAGCRLEESSHVERYGRKLDVHHIQKARSVSGDGRRNATSNLVALCKQCHPKWEAMSPLRPQTELLSDGGTQP